MGPPLLYGNNNARGLSVGRRGATASAPLLVFPDLSIVFQPPTIVMWKFICYSTCRLAHTRAAMITKPDLTNGVARNKLFWPRTLFCEAITVPPERRCCDCLGKHVAGIEGLTNTRQRTHRRPPLSSSAPSQDPATCSTSLTLRSRLRSWALTRQWCALWQRLTSILTSLLERIPWVFKRRHRTLQGCEYSNSPLHTPAQRILQPRRDVSLRGWTEASSRDEQIIFGPSLTDDSVLLRPTVAQSLNLVVPSGVPLVST